MLPTYIYTLHFKRFSHIKMSANVFFNLFFLEHSRMVLHSLFCLFWNFEALMFFNNVFIFTYTTIFILVFCHPLVFGKSCSNIMLLTCDIQNIQRFPMFLTLLIISAVWSMQLFQNLHDLMIIHIHTAMEIETTTTSFVKEHSATGQFE